MKGARALSAAPVKRCRKAFVCGGKIVMRVVRAHAAGMARRYAARAAALFPARTLQEGGYRRRHHAACSTPATIGIPDNTCRNVI